jgi:hypothetical protein
MQWGNPALMRQILVISGHPLRRHPPALANDREKPIDPALAHREAVALKRGRVGRLWPARRCAGQGGLAGRAGVRAWRVSRPL